MLLFWGHWLFYAESGTGWRVVIGGFMAVVAILIPVRIFIAWRTGA
jgi:hypothetical protein